MTLGTQLEQLCQSGKRDVLLVSPFIKVSAFQRLLAGIADEVSITCVTRWRPEEIVAGVNDLEIWPLLRDRPRSMLWLRSNLHAKFYRADDRCLVGSANITNTALGWMPHPNLELLVAMPAQHPTMQAFETEIFRECLLVDQYIFEHMSKLVGLVEPQIVSQLLVIHDVPNPTYKADLLEPYIPAADWLPTLRQPADLYLAYAQRNNELTEIGRAATQLDLREFPVPPGLPRSAFDAYVGVLLIQKPLIQKIDALLITPQRFGAVRDFLSNLSGTTNSDFDATRAWQTLMRWLLYFLPMRYMRIPSRHSEVIQRITP